jgi:hypothetical protein
VHVVGLVPVDPEAPHHLAIDPVGGHVYVGISNVGLREGGGLHGSHGGGDLPSYVQRLRLSDLVADGDARVDTNLGDVLLTPDRARVLSTHFDLARALGVVTRGEPPENAWASLDIVDPVAMSRVGRVTVCTAPHGAAVTANGATVIVACYGDDGLAIVDLGADPPVVSARLPVGPGAGSVARIVHGPYAVALSPDGTFAYVSTLDGGDLRVFDVTARAMVDARAIELPGAVYFGAFSPDGARFYAPTQARDAVVAVDPATDAIVTSRELPATECRAPHEVAYVAALDRLAVACEGDRIGPGALLLLDPSTLATTGRVELGIYPDAIRIVDEVTW